MNSKLLKVSLFTVCMFLFGGCVSQPEKVYTASGKPEVTTNAPLEMMKEAILGTFVGDGWVVENDSKFSTTMTKPCGDSFSCAMGQVMIGNSYSTAPKMELAFSWIKTTKGNKVMVSRYDISTQMAFGQVNRASLLNNNTNHNQLLALLKRAKASVEEDSALIVEDEETQTI